LEGGVELPGVIEDGRSEATVQDEAAAGVIEGNAVMLAGGRRDGGANFPPLSGAEIETPQVPERTRAEAGGAAAVEEHLIACRVENGVVEAAANRAAGGWSDVRPAVRGQVEGEGVIEAASVGEAVRDDEAIAAAVENGGVAVAAAGPGAVVCEAGPCIGGDVVGLDVGEEAGCLPAKDDETAAKGIEVERVAEAGIRFWANRGELTPLVGFDGEGPEVVAGDGVFAAEQVDFVGGGVVGDRTVEAG
jgi:hypothetical protein